MNLIRKRKSGIKLGQRVIVLMDDKGEMECWGSLTEICRVHTHFKYATIKSKKFPFEYKGVMFFKLNYRHKNF